MVASTSITLSENSQKAFLQYYRNVQSVHNSSRVDFRGFLTNIDRAYQREADRSEENKKAKTANRQGDTSRYQNMVVPVVMPQVETAVTYQASVFLTGDPIFGVTAGPEFITEALQMQSILEEQSIRGGWARNIMMFFRDGFKYNYSLLEADWGEEVSYSVETNLAVNLKDGTPKKVLWSGNKIERWDPYNSFIDPRVPPTEVYKHGEFAGRTQFMTRIRLKAFISELPDKIISSIVPAFESGLGGSAGAKDASAMNYYRPDINPRVSGSEDRFGGTNWLSWVGIDNNQDRRIKYKDGYEVTTLYCRVLPSEFGLRTPNSNTPQIYKLILVNHEHIIYCEQQTNAHNYIPVFVGQPLEDGLEYQTKSLADNAEGFQQLATSFMTAILESRRRAISDRTIFDPSRILAAHINSANPSAKIPVRPSAYGKNVADAVYAFPYREDQATVDMSQISAILGMSNQLTGQNQASQGQFVKGNKTLSEFESVMANANGRDQMVSILLEHQCFVPIKHVLKLNILQFQGGTTVYNRDAQKTVEIDPVALRKAVMDFRISDGLIPSDKIMNGESFSTAIQVIGSSPEIAQGYNLAPMFSYLMKSRGADLTDFEKSPEQLAYEQALGAWQNLVTLAIEKGTDPTVVQTQFPPQPLPEQFGYNPAGNTPAPDTGEPDQSPQAGNQ